MSLSSTHRPALVLVLAYAAGIIIGYYLENYCVCLLLITAVAIMMRHWILALIATGALMMSMYQQMPPAPQGIVIGIVSSEITQQRWANGIKQSFIVRYPQGLAQVDYYGTKYLRYGDALTFEGKSFRKAKRYQQFNDTHGIWWQISVGKNKYFEITAHDKGNPLVALGLMCKEKIVRQLKRYLDADVAPTVSAMVIGDRTQMPKDVKEMFIRSGTAHILAISGMNMAIVAAMFFFILKLINLPRVWQLGLTIVLLWIYTLAGGFSPSIVRACIMATVFLSALLLEEDTEALNALGVAAFVLLLLDPGNLFDIGFQLSFAAVAGILVGHQPLTLLLSFLPQWLNQSVAVSLAASLATAPFLFWHFKTFTPIAVIANIPIVPIADVIVLSGLILALSGLIFPPMAVIVAVGVKGLFYLLMWLAYLFSNIPGGHINFAP